MEKEEKAEKEKNKENEEAMIGIISPLKKEVNCRIKCGNITKWTSGVDLLAFFYKLILSFYTVKAF